MLTEEDLAAKKERDQVAVAQVQAENVDLIGRYNSLAEKIKADLDDALVSAEQLIAVFHEIYALPTAIAQVVERATSFNVESAPGLLSRVQDARRSLGER